MDTPGGTYLSGLPAPAEVADIDPGLVAMLGLPGLDQLRHGISGKSVPPPVDSLFGIRLDEVAEGRAEARMPVTDWLRWSDGLVPESVLAVFADSVHIAAVVTTVPPATGLVTVAFDLAFTASEEPPGGCLTAVAQVAATEDRLVLSTVRIRDAAGRVRAVGSARSSLFRMMDPAPEPPADIGALRDARLTLEPWRTAPRGTWEEPETYRARPGAERVRLAARDRAPLRELTGLTLSEGGAALPSSPWLASPLGSVQGGVLGLLAERAAWSAATAELPAGGTCRALDLKVNFTRRSGLADGTPTAVPAVRHVGRTIATVGVDITEGGTGTAHAAVTLARSTP